MTSGVGAALRIALACGLSGCAPRDGGVPSEGAAPPQGGGARPAATSDTDSPPVEAEGAQAPVEPLRFDCNEGAGPAPDTLRRLTATQYGNTLTDLTALLLGDRVEARALVTMAGLARVPADRRAGTAAEPGAALRRLDQVVEQDYVDETFQVARTLAQRLIEPSRLERVVGACAVDDDVGNDEACLLAFLQRFGARALRRPLDETDVRFHRTVYGSDPTSSPARYADLITVLLSSPELLYFVEHGGEVLDESAGTYALTAHELASRLSYHFWQTLPDEALWKTAQDGSLLAPEVLSAQVQRLMEDPRARTTLAELFGDVLALEELPLLDAFTGDRQFAAFAGEDLPGPELREEIAEDVLDMLAYYTWSAPAGARALLTSERSFARGPALARIYGVEPWDGSSEPPELPAGERPGLLTRAWLLASGTGGTRPIRRGVLVRRRLLCDDLAPPPMAVSPESAAPQPQQTTREAVEALTEQPGTACALCHATLINPLGFTLEGFDGLGRARSEEHHFDAEGMQVHALSVDTRTVPRVTPGDPRQASGPAELVELVLESGKLEACLARHYFRFAFGRVEDLERDGCVLERLRRRLVESGRIRDMVAEVGVAPALLERTFGGAP